MRKLLYTAPIQSVAALAIFRVIIGIFMAYHGWEVWDAGKMKQYAAWMVEINFPLPGIAAYTGKSCELIGGTLLILGLLTRFAALLLAITMAFITFGIGQGRFFMEDQHPFMFVLVTTLFFFLGGGDFSLDNKLFGRM
jgi:putative oxidoreductase